LVKFSIEEEKKKSFGFPPREPANSAKSPRKKRNPREKNPQEIRIKVRRLLPYFPDLVDRGAGVICGARVRLKGGGQEARASEAKGRAKLPHWSRIFEL